MPVPFLVWAGSVAGASAIGSAVGTGANVVSALYISPALKPSERAAAYRANVRNANLKPSIEQAVSSFWYGFSDWQTLRLNAAEQGVGLPATIDGDEADPDKAYWREVIQTARPRIPTEVCLTAKAMGLVDQTELNRQIAITGFYRQGWWEAFRARNFCPSYSDAIAQWRGGVITFDQLEEVAARQGMYRNSDKGPALSYTEFPDIFSASEMYRRELITADRTGQLFGASGFVDQRVTKELFDLADARTIPPISDLVTFAVKEAFTPEVFEVTGLYDEYPQSIHDYATKQGLGRKNVNVGSTDGAENLKSWSEVYWAAHWQPIAPSQAYVMLQRLRPETMAKYAQLGFNIEPFTIDDVRRWLRISDYPPAVRDQLAAISYRPMRLVDIRRGVQLKTLTDAQALSAFQDLGFDLVTAEFSLSIVKAGELQKKQAYVIAMANAAGRKLAQSAIDSYKAGLIDEQGAKHLLGNAGFDFEQATLMVMAAEADVHSGVVKDTIRQIKSSYMMGAITPIEVSQALAVVGINQPAIQGYLTRWQIQRTLPKRMSTATQIAGWFSNGLMTADQASQRLANLGLNNPDIALMLMDANKKRETTLAKERLANERTNAARVKALEDARDDAAKHQEDLSKRIKQLTPVSTLVKWLKDGTITDDEFIDRLKLMRYPDDVILKYWQNATGIPSGKPLQSNGQTPP